jgi:hypothetical protein
MLKKNFMKGLFLLRSIFRSILLISLLFRWFIVDKLSYGCDVASYILLAIGLGGAIILEIMVYISQKNKKL